MSEQRKASRELPSPYRPVLLGLTYTNRQKLYERIDRRVDAMLEWGLLEEARTFYETGGVKTAAQAIGIKELKPYFTNESSLAACVETIKRETRRYAKRQLTWFRRDLRIVWLCCDEMSFEELLDRALGCVRRSLTMREES